MVCQELMTPLPTTCQPDHTLAEVSAMMKRDDVGAIPVVEDGSTRLLGLVTDRDIVVKAVADGLDPAQTAVSEVMSTDLVSCRVDEPVERALDLMTSYQIRRVPIVDAKGDVVGIISQADVATRLNEPEETGQVVEAISQPDVDSV
jgi:CBS domain-containing protein